MLITFNSSFLELIIFLYLDISSDNFLISASISLIPKANSIIDLINYFIKNNKITWSFKADNLVYSIDIDLYVLPCSWFDCGWIKSPYFDKEDWGKGSAE